MKKSILFVFATFFLFNLNGKAELYKSNFYELVSDEKNDSIPVGTCIVKGKVYEAISGNPIVAARVTTPEFKLYGITNSAGEYELTISESDSVIFFYHQSYGEIVVNNFDFKSQHLVTINFITGPLNPENMIVKKPVIYLYSDEPLTATLSLKPTGSMLFTYPTYENGWNVEILENGFLQVENQIYPYLFWEAEQDALNFVSTDNLFEGFYIKTDSTIQFLENKLDLLGFNSTEKTDFITFWAPILMSKSFATVQFLVDADYHNNIAELTVNPLPDSQRRVFMLFHLFEVDVQPNAIIEPNWPVFERSGFSLFEWGGSNLTPNYHN